MCTMKTPKSLANILLINLALLSLVAAKPQRYMKDKKSYIIEADQKYNWYQAWTECAKENMQLFGVDSEAKNQELIQLLQKVLGKSHNLWIDGVDDHANTKDTARPFYAMSTGKRMPYTYWYSGQPDNFRQMESCIHVWDWSALYQWNDNRCDTPTYGYVCEEKTPQVIKPLTNKDDVIVIEDMPQMSSLDQSQPMPLGHVEAYKYILGGNEKLASPVRHHLPLPMGIQMALEETTLDDEVEFNMLPEVVPGMDLKSFVKPAEQSREVNNPDWRYTVRNIQQRTQNDILGALLEQRTAINDLIE